MKITATKIISHDGKSIARSASMEITIDDMVDQDRHQQLSDRLWRLVQSAKPSYSDPETPNDTPNDTP